ncbi:FUSC family protein [Hymenobacter lapidiphilus]|uniref:FUSC family protein n=1 Tax=Hymenobacter lapidiphilus TaxID=2608003 RepID=A0A7Y7PMD0_9BACT|nr:FUSC family protein [Hymenobacter lapidiphilus]NVO30471.1 FUSC family protein [Hymenobacter lapidiphilus]
MPNDRDYAALPLEELLAEEKSIKRNQLLSAGTIGFLVGVMVYGLVKSGFGFLYLAIPLFLIAMIYRNSQGQKQTLAQIRQEIAGRRTA